MVRNSLLLLLASVLILGGCSEKEFNPSDPAASFASAKQPYDDGNYEIAVTKLNEFKARFPYSQYAVESDLLIADAEFQLEHYLESAQDYEQFAKLHPRHAKVDYALFRIGESYWKQAPDDSDRDQEYTKKAIDAWQTLVDKDPKSTEAAKAKDLIAKGEHRLAEHEAFIAQFYCKKELYDACAYRNMQLLEHYPQFKDLREKALRQAADALDQVAKNKAAHPDSDKNLFDKNMTAEQIKQRADEFRKEMTLSENSKN